MADPIKLKLAAEAFERTMGAIKLRFDRNASLALFNWGSQTVNVLRVRRLSGRPGLRRPTGNLARSFTHSIKGSTIADLQCRIFTRCEYARIHEYGTQGVPIRSKRPGGFLAIPIKGSPAVQGGSNAGLFTSPLRTSLAPFGPFAVLKGRKDGLVLAQVGGKKPVPWFTLKKSVEIRPRMKFRETMRDQIKVLRKALIEGLGKAKRG